MSVADREPELDAQKGHILGTEVRAPPLRKSSVSVAVPKRDLILVPEEDTEYPHIHP